MSILVPTTEATIRSPRSSRPAVVSVVVLMFFSLSASALRGTPQPSDPVKVKAADASSADGKEIFVDLPGRGADASSADGKEIFVDLPGRGEALPGVAGANFGSADDKPAPQKKIKSGGKLTDDPLPGKPPEGWQEYVQEKYKAYSIWLPKSGRKLFQTEGVLDLKEFKLGYVVLRCDIEDDVTLNIQRLIIPLMKGETLDAQTVIEIFRDLHQKDVGGTITEEFDLMLGKMPGKEYRLDLKGGEKSRVRIYQTGRAIWRVWVTGTKEQVMGDTTKLIFASFKNQLLIKDQPAKKP